MLKQGKVVVLDSIRDLINNNTGCSVRLRLSPDELPAVLQPLMGGYEEGCYILAVNRLLPD